VTVALLYKGAIVRCVRTLLLHHQHLFFKGLCIMMKKKPMPAKKEAMSKMADKAQDKKEMMKEMMKEKMAKAKKKSMK